MSVAVDVMMRRDAWRALNVIALLTRSSGSWVTAKRLLDVNDLEPDALVWLDDQDMITAINHDVEGPVSLWSVVNPPGDRHRPGSPYDPGRVYVQATPAGRQWRETNPYQSTLAAAHASRGRLVLRKLVARYDLDPTTLTPLADAGLILIANDSGITLATGQGPIHTSRLDMATCTATSSAEGRRLLGVTG